MTVLTLNSKMATGLGSTLLLKVSNNVLLSCYCIRHNRVNLHTNTIVSCSTIAIGVC